LSNIEPTPFGAKYTLVEHIATGGMAEVYRAQYAGIEGFAKELVVKTLREEFAARPEVVEMFLDEARVAATLTHGNVVHTYDLGEIGGEYFIAMELLKGEELVAVLRRSMQVGRPIPMELGIGIIMQSCDGLHYVHSRTDDQGTNLGLVHRDINPTNIHVGYDGACKILDFGIAATRASAVAKKGQVAGKLSYMAPEQLQGLRIDHRADIFPLGVVLYELCLRKRLFRGQRDEVARRVLEGDIPPPTFVDPDFPPALEAIIMKALEVDPGDRYQNCDHMFRDLEAFLAESGMSWTPRKLSALMAELFGEGAPAVVDYEDQYDDLEDEALDFDAFDNLEHGSPDDAPAWAQQLESAGPSSDEKRKTMTLGSLEALVAAGKLDESGPNPVVPRRTTPAPGPVGEPRRSGRFSPVKGRPGTGAQRTTRRKTGLHGNVSSSGPMSALTPDPSSAFGRGVLTEQSSKGGAAWAWILGAVAFFGLAYFAYTLFTSK
jgi:serine/threonine-protein kinase